MTDLVDKIHNSGNNRIVHEIRNSTQCIESVIKTIHKQLIRLEELCLQLDEENNKND